MIDKGHINRFRACKNYVPPSKNIKILISDIYFFIPIINSFIEKYEIDSVEELKSTISYFLTSFFEKCSQNTFINSRLYEIQAIESILKDTSIINRELPKIQNKQNTHSVYSSNLTRSQRLVLINALDEISKIEAFASRNEITANTNPKNVVIHAENKEDIQDFVFLTVELLKQKTLNDKIIFMLQNHMVLSEDFVKNSQISFMDSLYKFFSCFNVLDDYLLNYKTNCEKFGLSALTYELSTDLYDKNSIGLEELFTEDFLKTLPLKDLCYLSAFWCNRFAKEANRMTTAFSAINSLNLWQDILNGKTTFNFSEKTLIAASQKTYFISKILGSSFATHQSNIMSREINKNESNNQDISNDYTDYYIQLSNYLGNDYYDYFSTYLHGENDLLNDVAFLAPFVNLELYAYCKKDFILEPLVKELLDNSHLRNWGIIRNEITDGQSFDSISSKAPRILLAFDVEGFNTPFRFHMNRASLEDLIACSESNPLIREYQGAEDFVVNNEVLPSNIVMPVPKRHKQIIINSANSNTPNKNLWEHLYFLMNGKFPAHLMEPIAKNKKQTVLTRMPVFYTDLKSGKRYVKKDNKFVEVEKNEQSR